MPREHRKRGKKHKKRAEESDAEPQSPVPPEAGPSWIIREPHNTSEGEFDEQAPFGHVDAEVKAYFRTVDVQIREWKDSSFHRADEGGDADPREERRLFFVAALTEMTGKEKQLATDAECSHILERMLYSMDDFARRVFLDSLAGSHNVLMTNRFASHICQTIFNLAADTVSRETRGILPTLPDSPEHGELRSMTQLVLDVCEEIRPLFLRLVMDQFASHVFRALLLLLCPSLASSVTTRRHNPANRSKKSAAWAARQGPLKSLFSDSPEAKTRSSISCPEVFHHAAAEFVQLVKDELGDNETRALAVNQVSSPVIQILVEIEADLGRSDMSDSLMDRILVGLISAIHSQPSVSHSQSDFVATLLRDATTSHLLETLVSRAPPAAFDVMWSLYFVGNLSRLAVHPIANFVLAEAVSRCNLVQLGQACTELAAVAEKAVNTNRTGVLRAMIDRAADLRSYEDEVNAIIHRAFGLRTSDDHTSLVMCALRLTPLEDYQSSEMSRESQEAPYKRHHSQVTPEKPTESSLQGAMLLQSLLRLSEPHNSDVVRSIRSLSIKTLLQMAHHPISSRVLDAFLDSPTVSRKDKCAFVLSLIGHFHLLVDDRIGSRVGDRCWAFADPYLREKIARSLFLHEQALAGSYYGKYFARKLNLYLLRRRPDEWKDSQLAPESKSRPEAVEIFSETKSGPANLRNAQDDSLPQTRKRKATVGDEIDAVFGASRAHKGSLDPSHPAKGRVIMAIASGE